MRQTVKFTDFMDEVQTWANGNHDDYSQTGSWDFAPNGQFGNLNFKPAGMGDLFKVDAQDAGIISQRAFTQICKRFHVPGDWAANKAHCPDELLTQVMNWKFQNDPDQATLVRQHDLGDGVNQVRGVLSDEYVTFDHIEIMNSVAAILKDNNIPVEVFRPEVGDTLRAFLLIGDGYFGGGPETKDGGLRPAVWVANDELGGSAVHIDGGVWRQVCTNGMIAADRSSEKFRIFHRWNTKPLLNTLVNEALAVAFKLSEAAATKFLEKQNETIPLTSLTDIVSSWSTKYQMPDSFQKEWETAAKLNSDGETLTLWDVINGVTAIARDLENADTRENAERMAGDLVFAPAIRAR